MAVTRSKGMTISDELKVYFSELIKPLVTNTSLTNLFEEFEKNVIVNLEKRISAQDEKIEELESDLLIKENTINLLRKRLDVVEVTADDNEQYSRRSCLRIHGIEFNEDDRENMDDILEKCCNEIEIPFNKNDIDRVHRTGRPLTTDGKTVKSIIVKFNSWNSRKRFYHARPRMNPSNKEKPGTFTFSVSPDLTKRRYELLKYARGIVNNNEKVAFVFADINCSLGIKANDNRYLYFNSKSKLDSIISSI